MTDLIVGSSAARRDRRVPPAARALENLEHEAVRPVQRCGKSAVAARCFSIGGAQLGAMGRRTVLATLKPTRRRHSTR
jgi:hypothetical protein